LSLQNISNTVDAPLFSVIHLLMIILKIE